MRSFLFVLIVLALLSVGALGLRTVSDCASDPTITRVSDRMECYHTAALSMAYATSDAAQARPICQLIWDQYGASLSTSNGNDQRKMAELISNNCYYDVAKVTKDPSTCGFIYEHDSSGTGFSGSSTLQDTCYDDINRLQQILPQTYYSAGKDNICTITFILPFLVIGTLKFRK